MSIRLPEWTKQKNIAYDANILVRIPKLIRQTSDLIDTDVTLTLIDGEL